MAGLFTPMQAHELFSKMSPALAAEILGHAQETAKPTFRVAVETLASQQRLRAVFVERKPKPERYAWLARALGRPAGNLIAVNLLQAWLVGAQAPMLADFCDALGIPHDGKGSITDVPPCPGPEVVRAAVDALLEKGHAPERVAIYLHCFLGMDPAAWAPLAAVLDQDERLRVG